MTTAKQLRTLATTAALALATLGGGCGFGIGDVELNGSVFDKLGVGSNSTSATRDVKVPVRQGLVLPPNLERLPEPGSGSAESQVATAALPVDPEQRRVAAASKTEREHREFCETAKQRAKVNNDPRSINGPLGRCDGSILDTFSFNTPVQIDAGGSAPAPSPSKR